MKKNLISIIILALCVVNLILNALMVFTFVPAVKKTDNLVTEIAAILNLEIKNANGDPVNNIDIANIQTYSLSGTQTIPLKNDGSGVTHYAVLGIAISMDGGSKDYETVSAKMPDTESWIFDVTRSVVQEYTIAEINDASIQDVIKKEIVEKLCKEYKTDCIFDVKFSSFITQ